MTDDTPTAPDGIYIRKRSGEIIHVGGTEQQAVDSGFYKQSCFRGMGELMSYTADRDRDCWLAGAASALLALG